MLRTSGLPLLVALGLLAGCDTPTVAAYDRGALLSELVERTMLPGQTELDADVGALDAAVGALCAEPTASTLDAAQAAWREAHLSWMRSEPYQFGPAEDANIGTEIYYFPADSAAIDALIAGSGALDEAAIDELGAQSKGLLALEYLLFATDDATTLAALTDTPRRCEAAAAIATHTHAASSELLAAWQGDTGFAHTLTTAGLAGNSRYPAQASAVSAVLTQVLESLEKLKVARLGTPLGLITGTPAPETVQAHYAEASVEGMVALLDGVAAVWAPEGATHDFEEFQRSRRPALADEVTRQIASARAAVAAVPEPLAVYATSSDLSVGTAAHVAVRLLERTLGSDVSTSLAISVMFTDSDGD